MTHRLATTSRVLLAAIAALTLIPSASVAQTPAAGIAPALQRAYNTIKTNLTGAAALMPEADYNSKPSTMPTVRTFGKLFGHVANAQFSSCAVARGVPNPNMGTDNEQLTTKAQFVAALAASFAFCDPVFASLTEQSVLEPVTGGRGGSAARLVGLFGMISHSNEMYGTAAVYLRSKNIVPPSTDEAPAPGGD